MRALTLMLLAVLAACDAPAPAPAPALQAPEQPLAAATPRAISMQVALPQPQVALPQQLSFELISAGSGARAPLRYAFAPGAAEYPVETQLASRAFVDGAWSPVAAQPAVRDGFAITIGDKPGLLAVRALPGDANPVWAKLLGGRRMTLAIGERGELGELRFADDPTGAHSDASADEAMQRLLGTVVPLPEPAVGVGASWQVTSALRQSGVIVKQTATYTLAHRTADAWTVHVMIRRDATSQNVSADVQLVAIFRVLEGDLTLSPARPIGTGTLAIESRVHARVTPPGAQVVDQLTEDTGALRLE